MKETENKLDNSEKVETENTASITMDSLTADDIFPEAQEHAIAAATEKAEAEKLEAQKAETQGEKVTYNKDGSIRKKRGRKPKGESTFKNPRTQKPEAANVPTVDSTQAATVISGILEQMQVTLISDEFKYNDLERDTNILSWKNTLDYYGGLELTPPMALAMSHTAIILSRATQPKTKTKFEALKAAIKYKFAMYKQKKKEAKNNALSDSGENNERQDNLRQEKGEKSKGKS